MPIDRRSFLIASGAALAGCSSPPAWNGFSYFTAGNPAGRPLLVAPVGPKGLAQWLGEPTIAYFVQRGFYVVGVHWSGLDGGDEDFGARYTLISEWLAFMKIHRPLMYAQSRGGLQLLNFACDQPQAFDRIACLFPVTDQYIFPGNGKKLRSAFDKSFDRARFVPNLKAAKLRGARVKIWHGDSDALVPKDATTDIFAAGSGAEVVTMTGVGHGGTWPTAIADFLAA